MAAVKPEVCPTSGLPFWGEARGVPHPLPSAGYRTHHTRGGCNNPPSNHRHTLQPPSNEPDPGIHCTGSRVGMPCCTGSQACASRSPGARSPGARSPGPPSPGPRSTVAWPTFAPGHTVAWPTFAPASVSVRHAACGGGCTRQAARDQRSPRQPAPSRRGGARRGVSSVDDLEGQGGGVDRDEDEDEAHRTRMDRTAAAATTTVAMAAKAADSTTVDSMTMVATTTVAAVAATKDSACGARGTGRTQQLSGAGEHVAGSLGRYHAGRQDRRGFHLQIPADRSGW